MCKKCLCDKYFILLFFVSSSMMHKYAVCGAVIRICRALLSRFLLMLQRICTAVIVPMLQFPEHLATSCMALWYVSTSLEMSLKSRRLAVFICRRVLGDSGVFLLSAVSPPPYVRSSRSVGRLSAITVDVRLCAPLQVTVGNHLLPRVRSARSLYLLWPEFNSTHSSQAYMCKQFAHRPVHCWFSCEWRKVLKLSHPEYKQAPPSRENLFTPVWNPSRMLLMQHYFLRGVNLSCTRPVASAL